MPGQPMKRAAFKKLDELGIEMVAQLVASGWSVKKLCEAEGLSSSYFFYGWIKKCGYRPKLDEARKMRAEILAEGAVEIADEVEPRRGAVSKAKLQIDARKWMAARLDPDRFSSNTNGPAVQVTIGELHLAALKSVNARKKAEREAQRLGEVRRLTAGS